MLTSAGNLRRTITHLLRDDAGQDLVEYALLTAVIAVGGVVMFSAIANTLQNTYTNRVNAAQAAWEPCPPQPATCP
jgi:Flp pilus assembly pilin Flp